MEIPVLRFPLLKSPNSLKINHVRSLPLHHVKLECRVRCKTSDIPCHRSSRNPVDEFLEICILRLFGEMDSSGD